MFFKTLFNLKLATGNDAKARYLALLLYNKLKDKYHE